MNNDNRNELISKINSLETEISARYELLNVEAIWLFVATLGCWSIYVPPLKLFALLIVLSFFSSKVLKDKKINTTFDKRLKELTLEVESSCLQGDSRKARLHEIAEVKNNLLTFKSIYRSTPKFLMSYVFWCITSCFALWQVWIWAMNLLKS